MNTEKLIEMAKFFAESCEEVDVVVSGFALPVVQSGFDMEEYMSSGRVVYWWRVRPYSSTEIICGEIEKSKEC